MRETKYSKITIEGFQSISKPLTFQLDQLGLNLIKGANGKGKSTIFNAIGFAEYGLNPKKSVETWDDKRHAAYRGTRVVVDRSINGVDYRVARHVNFKGTTSGLAGGNKLMIFKKDPADKSFTKDHLMADGLHKKDMQLMIEQQLGMNDRVFQNSIVFGQRMAGLITMDNTAKRKLFDEFFDVAFVDIAKDEAKSKESELTAATKKLQDEFLQSNISMSEAHERLDEQELILKNFAKDQKTRIAQAKKSVDKYKDLVGLYTNALDVYGSKLDAIHLDNLKTAEEELAKTTEELLKLNTNLGTSKVQISGYLDEISKSRKNITDYETKKKEVDDNCFHCGQSLKGTPKSPEDSKKAIDVLIATEKKVITAMQDKVELEEKSKKKIEDKITNLTQNKDEHKKVVDSFATLVKDKATLEADLKSTKINLKNAKQDLKDATATLEEETNKKKPNVDPEATKVKIAGYLKIIKDHEPVIKENLAELSRISWWIKTGFSSSGLKAFVFNAMLTKLNAFCHKYASRLGLSVEFSVDMSKASKPFQTIVYKDGQPRFYEDFSGGQMQRIDLCIAFAMHDLVSLGNDINILVVDEILDGLDSEGVETAFEFMRAKAENQAVYLISHLDILDSMGSKTIDVSADEDDSTYIRS